jgi:hypothetical protein
MGSSRVYPKLSPSDAGRSQWHDASLFGRRIPAGIMMLEETEVSGVAPTGMMVDLKVGLGEGILRQPLVDPASCSFPVDSLSSDAATCYLPSNL